MRHTLLTVAAPLATYYGMRAFGQPELHALIAATVISGIQVLVTVVRNRRLDLVSAFLLMNFGLSLLVAVATNDARTAQASNTIPGIVLSLFFIASSVFGTPLTEVLVETFRPGRVAQLRAEYGWTDAQMLAYRRMHRRLSFCCGVISAIFSAISLAIIFSFTVDIAQGANQVFSLVSTAALVIGIVVVVRRQLRRLAVQGAAGDVTNR